MKYYIYKVEKIVDYCNQGATLDYDYTKEFNEIKRICGYVKLDYYITDTSDLKLGEVYYTGDLIKVIEHATEFDGDPIQIVSVKE